MEAEELDHIFRAKLDELEQVPDLVWEPEETWTKIGPKVKTSWGKFWTWGVMSTVGIISCLVWFIKPQHTQSIRTEKVITEVFVPNSKEVDTLVKLDKKPSPPKGHLPKSITDLSQNTMVEVLDTTSKLKHSRPLGSKAKEYWLIEPKLILNRSGKGLHLSQWDISMEPPKPIGFYLPQTPVLRLQMNNALNLSNAVKLFETLQEQGFSFRYSYVYRPSPFANNNIPFQKPDPRVIYINDYDK